MLQSLFLFYSRKKNIFLYETIIKEELFTSTQEKLFTLTLMETDVEATEQKLKELGNEILDSEKTKVFDVQGFRILNYSIVCSEETLEKIISAVNATKLY